MSDYIDISLALDNLPIPQPIIKRHIAKNTTLFPDWFAEKLYGNELLLILSAFAISLTLASWSYGIIFFFVFLVTWEIIYYIAVRVTKPYWFLEVRLAIIAASILGWLIGRELTGKDADKLDPLLGRPKKK